MRTAYHSSVRPFFVSKEDFTVGLLTKVFNLQLNHFGFFLIQFSEGHAEQKRTTTNAHSEAKQVE